MFEMDGEDRAGGETLISATHVRGWVQEASGAKAQTYFRWLAARL